MKCPYQTITIHEPETFTEYAKEKTTFSECLKEECPFYYTIEYMLPERHITGYCKRAESELERK